MNYAGPLTSTHNDVFLIFFDVASVSAFDLFKEEANRAAESAERTGLDSIPVNQIQLFVKAK